MINISESKNKVLIILSSLYNQEIGFYISFNSKVQTVKCQGIDIDYMIDPTQYELEKQILQNDYICIIPCSQYVFEKTHVKCQSNTIHNVIKTLSLLDKLHFGSDYFVHLLLNDKITYLKTSNIGIPATIMTSDSFDFANRLKNFQEWLPFNIEMTSKDSLIANRIYVNDIDDFDKTLAQIMKNDCNANEIFIEKDFSNAERIVITILGNPPLTENLVYIRDDFKIDTDIQKELINKSIEFFKRFSLKDFAQFEYVFITSENKYYLRNIDFSNCLNCFTIRGLTDKYKLKFKQIICSMVAIYLLRINHYNISDDIIIKLSKEIPMELTDKLFPLQFKRQYKKNYSYKDVCEHLASNFLQPDESNIIDVSRLFESAINKLPTPEYTNSPYLGNKNATYNFLNQYDTIPSHPGNVRNILYDSLKVLNGQTRWHSPTMLNNVDPPTMFNTVVVSAITNIYNPSAMEHSSSAGYLYMEEQIVKQLSCLIGWNACMSGGTFTSGGKNCINYAIKCGLNRCLKNTCSDASPIVITSDINHYSVEIVCNQLGLTEKACVRIPSNNNGTIDLLVFRRVLYENLSANIPIACIIFSGGNTTHCTVENIESGCAIINEVVNELRIKYVPYVYYDLVVCWPWLFFKQYDFYDNPLKIKTDVLNKIKTVKHLVENAYLADGIGIDFHKLGLAPLPNSLFLTQNASELHSLFNSHIESQFREPYHYTLCNSRPSTHIISAWNILQCMGYEGFQSYIANMMTVTSIFAKILQNYDFEILGKGITYGYATIIWSTYSSNIKTFDEMVSSSEAIIDENNQYLYEFSEYLKENHSPGYFLRFLPNYKYNYKGQHIATLSILPMTLNIDEGKAEVFAHHIGCLKHKFDKEYVLGQINSGKPMPPIVPK